ncbi:MAG: acetylhydrolase [Ideonella sp.]|nr:acetylhydrolase [Ideonella sp.]
MKTLRTSPASPARRRLLLAALAVALLPGAAGADVATDEDRYRVLEFDWQDTARERAVPVRLYLPRSASRAQPVPLVVFSHGIGGSRAGYSYLGRHWAGQGFASLHLQHVGSDRSVWFGNPFGLPARLHDAAQEGEVLARVGDLRFALDRLLAGSEGERIDRERIAAAGHSYGANTTLLAVGARIERDGRRLALRDARLKAAVLISAPPFYGEASPAVVLGGIDVPSLHITATDDVIRIPGYYSPADDRVAVFDATGGPRKALAVFDGGSHSMFTDRAGTGGAQLNAQVKAATPALALAFLRQVFGLGGDEAWRAWPKDHRAILARFVAG